MSRVWIVIILSFCLIITSACTGANTVAGVTGGITQSLSSPERVSSETGTFFAINEVGLGQNGYVALTNFTNVPARLAGLYLCQGLECFKLPDAVVDAGKTVRVATGDGAGLEDVVATQATLGELRPADGEIALADSAKANNPKSLLFYYQWGSTPHVLTQDAVDAGLWVKGGFGPSSPNARRVYKDLKTGLWLFEEP